MTELMQKISLRELRLLLLGLGTIVIVAIVMAQLVPRAKALRSTTKEIAILEEAAQDGAELDRHLREQHEKIEELRYRLYGDMANLPVRQIEAYIIGRLQRVSWHNNVDLVSVEPATGERVQIFQEMLFNVKLIGQYRDLYQWLLDARDDLGFVVVKEYALSRNDSVDDRPMLLADLSLASYRAVE